MPHHSIGLGTLIAGFGLVPGSIIGVALFAQSLGDGHVDWANLGAVAAIIAMMGFLLTKLLPKISEDNNATTRKMNEDNNLTMRHMSDRYKESLESQRRDFIELIKRYHPETCEKET